MKYLSMIIFLLFFTGCATVTDRYKGEAVHKISDEFDKSLVEFTFKKNIKNESWAELKSHLLSKNTVIKGHITEDASDDIHFFIDSIRYFSNWPNGWTEGISEASGEILFIKDGNNYKIQILEDFEIWDIKKGEIRYQDNYYRNEDGLKKVKDRVDRIKAVVEFLKSKNFPDFYISEKISSKNEASFKEATQKFLFPETVGLDLFITSNDKNLDVSRDDFILGSGKLWRKDYTKKIFPENLQELRDTGSLWRDYEEALDLFFTFYNIDYFFKSALDGAVLTRVK